MPKMTFIAFALLCACTRSSLSSDKRALDTAGTETAAGPDSSADTDTSTDTSTDTATHSDTADSGCVDAPIADAGPARTTSTTSTPTSRRHRAPKSASSRHSRSPPQKCLGGPAASRRRCPPRSLPLGRQADGLRPAPVACRDHRASTPGSRPPPPTEAAVTQGGPARTAAAARAIASARVKLDANTSRKRVTVFPPGGTSNA